MAWYNKAWDFATKNPVGRVATAVATGGLSEAGGARTVGNAAGYSDQDLLDKAKDVGRNLPVIGNLIPAEQTDPNSIDTGQQFFGRAGDALQQADQNFSLPNTNAQMLYSRALQGANASYGAGQLRDADLSGASRLVGAQDADLARLNDAAAGRGPSAAQSQYAAGLSQAKAQALAVANTSRGAGRGAARLQALSNFGAQAGQQAQQAAARRAQEMQSAQQAYSGALAGARGQDTGLATTGAQLQLQHDTAQEGASRAAFDSTQNAQHGALNIAEGAVGQQLGVAQGRAGVAGQEVNLAQQQAAAKQRQYELALAKTNAQAAREAGNRQSLTKTAVDYAAM